ANSCNLCRENFVAGVELYGGLGDTESFGLHQTSHYFAPALAWNLPSGWAIRISPGFGLNSDSHRLLMRWGLSYEFIGFGERISGRRWKESAKSAGRRSAAGDPWRPVLGTHKWGCSPRHAGMVKTSRTATLGNCELYQDSERLSIATACR